MSKIPTCCNDCKYQNRCNTSMKSDDCHFVLFFKEKATKNKFFTRLFKNKSRHQ